MYHRIFPDSLLQIENYYELFTSIYYISTGTQKALQRWIDQGPGLLFVLFWLILGLQKVERMERGRARSRARLDHLIDSWDMLNIELFQFSLTPTPLISWKGTSPLATFNHVFPSRSNSSCFKPVGQFEHALLYVKLLPLKSGQSEQEVSLAQTFIPSPCKHKSSNQKERLAVNLRRGHYFLIRSCQFLGTNDPPFHGKKIAECNV